MKFAFLGFTHDLGFPGFETILNFCLKSGVHFRGYAPVGEKALAYHAWLESESTIIDFSTHSLRAKAAKLDALDGGITTVVWCPAYLILERSKILTLKNVTQAISEGVACYQEIPGLHEFMLKNSPPKEVDPQDLAVLRLLFDQPQMAIFGPNDLQACIEHRPSPEMHQHLRQENK